jgi:hypothetical protein
MSSIRPVETAYFVWLAHVKWRIMSTVPKQIARLALGLPLLYGLLPVAFGWLSLPRWDAFSMSVIAFIVMFAGGGVVMLSSLFGF